MTLPQKLFLIFQFLCDDSVIVCNRCDDSVIVSNDPITDSFTETALTLPPTDTFLVPTSSRSIPTAASKLSTKLPKRPSTCELLPVYDCKTNVEKCVKMSRISNKRLVIDVEVLELLFSDSVHCRFCHKGPVKLYQTSAIHGFGIHILEVALCTVDSIQSI